MVYIYSFSGALSKSKDSTGATVTIAVPLVVRVTGMRSVTAEAGSKGSAVRRLKRYVSWVQTVVRQVGFYLSCPLEN